jgi:hypothetical protein
MKKRRTNDEIASFVIGCSDASQLQEIHAIVNDGPLYVDRLEPRLREASGAIKTHALVVWETSAFRRHQNSLNECPLSG